MRHHASLTLIVFIGFFIGSSFSQDMNKFDLGGEWKFRKQGTSEWMRATVPGCVHLDLLNNKMIGDPFYRENEKDLQWISKTGWEYEKKFIVPDSILRSRHLELVLKGLDTYANVFLNDSLLLVTDNMFREWFADVRRFLIPGENTLKIFFPSIEETNKTRYDSLHILLPGEDKVVCRKAAYHFGWDWGPTFITSGIWKPVYIRFWDFSTTLGVQYVQNKLNDTVADLTAVFTLLSQLNDTAGFRITDQKKVLANQYAPLKRGINIIKINFRINHPKRWWSNGLGEPYLYTLQHQILFAGRIEASGVTKIGLRTLKLLQDKDVAGQNFTILLNGVPVFMKGANYIPQDNFPTRVKDSSYINLIRNVKNANMNMLRVWGGGIYEKDLFYDLCDENGILVWQDFMFACAMYPPDKEFLKNVNSEGIQNIVRLRNHPCLTLWCGNNEVSEGWFNWGWPKQYGYSPEDSVVVKNAYNIIFDGLLAQAVAKYDTNRSYISTSPKYGAGNPLSLKEGDMHYWGVWWGKEPFDNYNKTIGRFMSEYGFQGFPDPVTIDGFTLPEDRQLGSPVMKAHEKHPVGFETIDEYMNRDFRKPKDFASYAYVSQLLQAEGMKVAIEAHRRAKPYCMGTLFWQLNDCWPVVSWSSQDYYGRKKAMQFMVRKAYEKYLVSPVMEDLRLHIYIVSDDLRPKKASITLKLMDLSGKVFWNRILPVTIQPNSSMSYLDTLFILEKPEKAVLSAVLESENQALSENLLYFTSPKELMLEKPNISTKVSEATEGYTIELSSDKLAKGVWLSTSTEGEFSDNYFDIIPGETIRVTFTTSLKNIDLASLLKIRTLEDTY